MSQKSSAIRERDLSNKTVIQLEELLARENVLLQNARLLEKLADKGVKVREAVAAIERELVKRRDEERSQKRVTAERTIIDKLEWKLKAMALSSLNGNRKTKALDSDDSEPEDVDEIENDDELNPLRIIATSQLSQRSAKKLIEEIPKDSR